MTVYFNQTLIIPYAGMILRRNPVNISILAGNDDIVLILYDPSGSQYDFSIAAGQKIQELNFDLFRFEITGSGQAAIAISYPEVIEPSIEITLNPNLPQSVSSSQLPAALDSNGFFKIRYLGGSDVPGRGWLLGSTDVPNRGWNLGSSDVPGRGWTLGSLDNPDTSINQVNNFKTDIGQANTYLKDTKIPNPMAQDSSNNLQINFAAQNVANLINTNLDSQFFYDSDSAEISNYSGSYFKVTATVGSNSFVRFKRIYFQPNLYGSDFRLLLSNENNFSANQAIQIPASSSLNLEYMGWKTLFNNTATSAASINFFQNSSGIPYPIYEKSLDTIINTNTSTATWSFEEYIKTGASDNVSSVEGNILIEYEIIGSISWATSYYNASSGSSGSGTGTTGGGGGCWSGDTIFLDGDGKPKAFSRFREGDMIMTVNGAEKIEKIQESGLHEVIQISPNIWITPLQPYRWKGSDRKITEEEYQQLPRRFVPTFDCIVPSIWLKTVNPDILIKDVKKNA